MRGKESMHGSEVQESPLAIIPLLVRPPQTSPHPLLGDLSSTIIPELILGCLSLCPLDQID